MEVDLAFRGVDLLTEFQACRVRYLLNLVLNGLPRNTRTHEAMSQDPELVAAMDAGRADSGPRPIAMRDYSPEVEALQAIELRIGDVASAVIAGNTGKRPPKIPAPRPPETAWDRISHERDMARHDWLKAQLLPNGPQELPETG